MRTFLSWLGLLGLAGSLTITIPDAKDAKVAQARNLYNARTGQSLTIEQYVKEAVRRAVVGELVITQQETTQAAIEGVDAAAKATIAALAPTPAAVQDEENQGW